MEISVEDMNSIHFDLEQAQMTLAQTRGLLLPFVNKPWAPVARRQASEKDVDDLVEQAEQELDNDSSKKKNSKMEQARILYNENEQLTRKEMLAKFVAEIGLSLAAASTYYQGIKRSIK